MRIDRSLARAVAVSMLTIITTLPASAAPRTLRLAVDAREAPRRILRARLVLPARPGTLSLTYPAWIPGNHAPTGPINDLVDIRITAGKRTLPWRRDDVDAYTIRCVVPSGATEVEVGFALVSPSESDVYESDVWATERLATLNWDSIVLAPSGLPADSIECRASLRLPAGWKYATPLPVQSESGGEIHFRPVSLTTLVDSPVMAGLYVRSVPLTASGDARPVTLDVACDDEAGLAVPDTEAVHLHRLVSEADALFGARHFGQYHFLLALSDHVDHFGLEHHESSDDRLEERMWLEADTRLSDSMLMPHEYVHSWNGKYRRPAGLVTGGFEKPMRDELLWVYEGLTEYLGWMLATRSGLLPTERSREYLATVGAYYSAEPGRGWRPLLDTAVDAAALRLASHEWRSWRRGIDYYDESILIWLEADVTIRRLTGGRRSLDDFCRAFHGGASGPPRVVPYTREDVLRALNAVAPYDWRAFFAQRVDSVAVRAPLGGIEGGGWRLAWSDTASDWLEAVQRDADRIELYYSLGVRFNSKTGAVLDVMPETAADRAGLTPGMKLVAVNGRKWTKDVLLEAVRAGRKSGAPIQLTVESGEMVRTLRVESRSGLRYPKLERVAGAADVLDAIMAPRAPQKR